MGSKLAPFLIGVHVWTPNIHVCNHRITSAHWMVQICTLRGGMITGAGLYSEGCTDMRVQTSTLTGANLSWLHLYGCKLAFGVLVLWHFGDANLYLYFLMRTIDHGILTISNGTDLRASFVQCMTYSSNFISWRNYFSGILGPWSFVLQQCMATKTN